MSKCKCKGRGEEVGLLLFDMTEEEDEAMTGEAFGEMTWCLIPGDTVFGIVILVVRIVFFFTLLGFGRLLVTVIFPDDFLVEIGLFIVVVIEIGLFIVVVIETVE